MLPDSSKGHSLLQIVGQHFWKVEEPRLSLPRLDLVSCRTILLSGRLWKVEIIR